MQDQTISNIIEQFSVQCRNARSEDDIKGASNIFFNKIGEALDITISSHNEITSAYGGRVDSIYNNIYFEYKKLKLFSKPGYDGVNEAVYGRDERDHGLFHYLVNFALEQSHDDFDLFVQRLTSSVGVGFDGNQFVFCRFKISPQTTNIYHSYKTKRYPKSFPKEVNVTFESSSPYEFNYGVKRILLFLRSTKRKRLSADSLCSTFNADTEISKNTIVYLRNLLEKSLEANPRITTLYNEWDRIFGTIYGEQESDFVKQVEALQKFYPFRC